MASNLYLSVGGLFFAVALGVGFLKKLHPLGLALLAPAVGFLGAVCFQVALSIRMIDAFGALSGPGGFYEDLPRVLLGMLQVAQLGLVLLLAVSVATAFHWWRRQSDLSLYARLAGFPKSVGIGILLFMALLAAGLWVLHENTGRLFAFSMAVLAPEEARDLPPQLAQVHAMLQGQPLEAVADGVSFRLVAGTVASLILGAMLLLATLLALVTGWIRPRPEESPPPVAPGAKGLLGFTFFALVALGAIIQIWRLEEVKSWVPAVEAAHAAPSQEVTWAAPQANVWLVQVEPVYPEAARLAGVEGQVLVRVTVDRQGSVTDATIVEGDPLLRQAAIDAVRQWKMDPTLLEGSEEPESLIVNLEFTPD